VEALAVMILLVTFVAGSIGLGRVYAAKLASMRRAREAAWSNTQQPCAASRQQALLASALVDPGVAPRGRSAALLRAALEDLGQAPVSVGRAEATTRPGQGRALLQTATRFSCNELAEPPAPSLQRVMAEVLR